MLECKRDKEDNLLDWNPENLLPILSLEYILNSCMTRFWSLNFEYHFFYVWNRRKYSEKFSRQKIGLCGTNWDEEREEFSYYWSSLIHSSAHPWMPLHLRKARTRSNRRKLDKHLLEKEKITSHIKRSKILFRLIKEIIHNLQQHGWTWITLSWVK